VVFQFLRKQTYTHTHRYPQRGTL